jgi:ERCC4-type nuclease
MVKKILSNIEIIIDTREQDFWHIARVLKNYNIKFYREKLDFGDYGFRLKGNPLDFTKKIAVERKRLNELASNFQTGKKGEPNKRERFKNEFRRADEIGARILLMIEDAMYADIENHNYRSNFHPNCYKGSLNSLKRDFDMDIFFIKEKKNCAFFILKKFIEYVVNNKIEV